MINLGPALHFGFSLFLLWGLVFFCWREFRLDYYRNELFALRYRLFVHAAEGHISFDAASYRVLRSLINGLIRFAHKMSLTRLLTTAVGESHPIPKSMQTMARWRAEVDKLPVESRQELLSIHDQLFRLTMKFIAWGAPVVLLALVLLKGLQIISRIFRWPTDKLTVISAGQGLKIELLEQQALEELELEYKYAELAPV